MKKIIPLSLLIIFSASLFAIDTETSVKMGEKVPEFSFDLNNGDKILVSECHGKIVLINFFATWCPPCRKKLPHIQKDIWDKHKDNPRFVMLTFGREHSWDEVNSFKTEQRISFPIYPDTDRSVYSRFAQQMIPRSFVIDENGNIIYMSVGYKSDEFEKLKLLLESKLN
jgi:peroxiredoxin